MGAELAQHVEVVVDGPVADAAAGAGRYDAVVAAGGDAMVTAPRERSVVGAIRVAQLWLEEVTELSSGSGEGAAWSRAQWVERTMPVWGALINRSLPGWSRSRRSFPPK